MQNKVTVQERITSLTNLIIASFTFTVSLICLLLLENEAVQYPASKCDPVARPAQLWPLLNGMMGYIVL